MLNQTMQRCCAMISLLVTVNLASMSAHAQPSVPAGFSVVTMSPSLNRPVAMAFAGDGRIFVAERAGIVKVIQNNAVVSTFIDLSDEVNSQLSLGDRGLLGLALDPNFLVNRHVYLFYAVDPIFGPPDEGSDIATFSRLTRYTGTLASGGNIADAASRTVLIGETPSEGIPQCWRSHSTGALRFAPDGSLLLAHGESSLYGSVDAGGSTPGCFAPGMFGSDQNIGAFRAQMLDSMNGKIMRINPANGQGLPSNPYFNAAAPSSPRSRVWISGLRNPFRFALRPGTGSSTHPGSVYVGDVGRDNYEEISVARDGGENLGWPCYEGHTDKSPYSSVSMPAWGCDTLETPSNPGPVVAPVLSINHGNALLSSPPGITGTCVVAGAFHAGSNYHSPWRNGFFFADFISGSIHVLRTDSNDQFKGFHFFGSSGDGIVDFAVDPQTGDVCVLTMWDGRVHRIHGLIRPGDVDRNGVVNVTDLLAVISAWGPCPNPLTCPADLNVSGEVNVTDLLEVIANWG